MGNRVPVTLQTTTSSLPDTPSKQWGPPRRRIALSTLFDFDASPHGSFRFVETPQGDAYIGPVGPRNRPGGGNGVIFYRDGSAFVGRMENGKRHGYGTFIHAPTDVQYDGEWKEDYWHGHGCLYSVHDRTVLKGEWEMGELKNYGVRVDQNTGLSWRERYQDGRLMSQHLLDGLSSSSDSPSSQTTDQSAAEPAATTAAEAVRMFAGEVYAPRRHHRLPSERMETTLVGSPSFVKYTQGVCTVPIRPFTQRSAEDQIPDSESQSSAVSEPVITWSVQRVVKWLQETVQFDDSIVSLFENASVDGAKLLGLDRQTLKQEIGLFPFGYQMKVLDQIRRLKARTKPSCNQPARKTHEDYVIPPDQLEFIRLLGCDREFFSATYLGSWLGRTVAIKVYTGYVLNEDYWTEYVQTILTVRHPNLVLVLGVSYINAVVRCVVMEYATRGCLSGCLYGEQMGLWCDAWRRHSSEILANRPDVALSLLTTAKMVGTMALGGSAGGQCPPPSPVGDDTGSCIPMDRLAHAYHDDDDLASLAVGRQGTAESTTTAAVASETCPHVYHYLDHLIRRPNENVKHRDNGGMSPQKGLGLQALHQSLAITLAKGVVVGLIYLHRKKIYHLNLKPTNVLISGDWQPKLTDFGQNNFSKAFTNFPLFATIPKTNQGPVVCPHCAKVLKSNECGFSDGPEVEATVHRQRRLNWCSPEVLRLPLQYLGVNPESDIYSFGLLFSSMITNCIPCAGLSPTQIRVAVGYAKFRPHNVYLPLERLVGSCTAFDPDCRASWTVITNELFDLKRSAGSSAEDALVAFMQGSVST